MKAFALLIFCISLSACGLFEGKTEVIEEKKPAQPSYIGQINSIHAAQGFVLIRRSAGVKLVPGTILISKGPGAAEDPKQLRVANLRVSGESLGQMIAADIQSGSPAVGDSVHELIFMRPLPAQKLRPILASISVTD